MFRNEKLQRSIASLVLVTFTSLTLYPLTAAAQVKATLEKAGVLPKQPDKGVVGNAKRYFQKLTGAAAPVQPAQHPDERFSQLLAAIHDDLKAITPQTALPKDALRFRRAAAAFQSKDQGGKQTRALGPDMRIETERQAAAPLPGTDMAAKLNDLRAKAADLRRLYPAIEQGFAITGQELKAKKLPQAILDRQAEAVAQFRSRKAEFERLMGNVEVATDGSAEQQAALADLGGFMAQYPNAKPHEYTDPNKLPFKAPDGKVREPYTSKSQYQATLFPPKYEKVQLASLTLDGVQLAQATLPNTPAVQDTATTDDVQITPAIQAQAAALHNNPVEIYNWVRNNIAFIPSYGSIQGSDLTLQNKRGNAFDSASLLIALYRAAGIPARYVYGTIEVPAAQVMNWVGGVTSPAAAQSLLGQGGIPNVALVSGGQVQAFRLEHVWVEAYVDYTPSRGAINKNPSIWVAMDPSFKQYQFTQGMNVATNVPANGQDLLNQIQQGATIDTTTGYVQNLNVANLQTALGNYQTQAQNYINSQKTNPTVGDVLGTQAIVTENRPFLQGTLPYKTVAIGNTFQALPDNLKWKFKTNIYADDGISTGNDPIIEVNQATVTLAGKKITLSFVPATQADQDLINSYLPKPHTDGTPIQPSELPTSLPGYLLNMKAEFRIDGQMAAQTAGSFTMGSSVKQSSQYFNPSSQSWDGGDDNDVTVGEYDAIGMDLQGIGAQQLQTLQKKIVATQATLKQYLQNPTNTALISGMTKEDFAGDFAYCGILEYFGRADSSDRLLAATRGDVNTYRLPSYGRFFTAAQPYYWFGIARSVTFPGVTMDVAYLMSHAEAKNGDHNSRAAFLRQAGAASSFAENAVPEAMFSNPNLPLNDPGQPQGVSAVKLEGLAAAQGQKIYLLNQSNQANHASILQTLQIDQDAKTEIANALGAGKEVVVHEKNIAVNGWNGCGYTIIDPATGAGAYKISGGANGGVLMALFVGMAVALSALPFILIAAVIGETALLILTAVILAIDWVVAKLSMPSDSEWRTFAVDVFGGILVTLIGGLFFPLTMGALLLAIVLSFIYAIFDSFVLAMLDDNDNDIRYA